VKATSIVAAALLAAGTTASAQEIPSAAPPQGVSGQAVSGPVAPQTPAASRASREDIRAMESLLTGALQIGAQDLAKRMQVNDPGSRFVTGTGRARGFALDGYGIFFDVDVPGMKQSLVWSAEMLRQMQQAETLRQFIARTRDADARQFALVELNRIERQMSSGRATQAIPAPPLPGQAVATVVSESSTTDAVAAGAGARALAAAPPAPPVSAVELRDPNELYTDAVKNALIDAMLKYSSFLKIGADEWLTVAARDSEGPAMPGQIDDASTIVISIKGGDLAAYQSNKLTREEVLKRVQVKEF
jgi:hypothetical protein